MNVPVTLFVAISSILFCVLFVVIVRLTFDRMGNHLTRGLIGLALFLACSLYWLSVLYHEANLIAEIGRHACLDNLREIHRHTINYQGTFARPPEELRELARRSDLKPTALVCPATRAEYQYAAVASRDPMRVRAYDSAPHAHDYLWLHHRARHILYASGEVRWLEEADFQILLDGIEAAAPESAAIE